MPFFPWRVRDLRDDGLDALARRIEAVVEAHGIERIAEVAQVREQADGSGRPRARATGHEVAHGFIERLLRRLAMKIRAPKPGGRSAPSRPEEIGIEKLRQLGEVEVRHEERYAKRLSVGSNRRWRTEPM